MNSLISINYKFMFLNPLELSNMIKNTEYCKGAEIYIDLTKEDEIIYLKELVDVFKRNNLILQVHACINFDIDLNISYLKELEKYADILGYSINVTFHYICDDNRKILFDDTIKYISNLINNIDLTKINICIENLNNGREVFNIIKNTSLIDKVYFTYDIGHEIYFCSGLTNISDDIYKRIKNVHIHSYDDVIFDHYPIYNDDKNLEKLKDAINLLKRHHYVGNIVFEYGLEYCHGENSLDNLKDYLNSIDYVSSLFKFDE